MIYGPRKKLASNQTKPKNNRVTRLLSMENHRKYLAVLVIKLNVKNIE